EPQLADSEAIHEHETRDEHGREHDRSPCEQRRTRAARGREPLDEKAELELAERRRQARALQHDTVRAGRRVETGRVSREARERVAAARDDERGRVGQAAAPIRRRDDAIEENALIDEQTLDVTPTVAPR